MLVHWYFIAIEALGALHTYNANEGGPDHVGYVRISVAYNCMVVFSIYFGSR